MHRLFTLIVIFALGSIAGWHGFIQSQEAAAATPTPAPTAANDQTSFNPSPDGGWTAVVNADAGSLDLRQEPDGPTVNIFPAGSTIGQVAWSPDSSALLVVQNNWIYKEPLGTGVTSSGPITLWQVDFKDDKAQPARQVFQSNTLLAQTPQGEDNAEQIVFGQWSPDGQTVLFWLGPLGASVLMDGLPLFALNMSSDKVSPVAEWALLNPRYQSWSPDSARLAVTAGADRVAQTTKWLVLWDAATGQSTTVISQTEQIPGIVAWSPQNDWLAYAAVPVSTTADDSASVAGFDNPAIAGRRVYLLNLVTKRWRLLNGADSFQDNPLWSDDGSTLYYIERQGDALQLMAADPKTGQAEAVPNVATLLPEYVGYYGQSEFDWLLEYRPDGAQAGQPVPMPSASTDQINETPAPDGSWTASLNQTAGSLTLRRESDGQSVTVFSAGDSAFAATWSPDSQRLLVVRTNWQAPTGNEGVQASNPIEIWQVQFKDGQPGEPARLYQSAAPPEDGPQQIVFGHWSPDSRYVLFWEGILSASILSDGLPLAVLDVTSGQVHPVAEIALLNPRYQSWSPDSTRLAVTAGGYRSAQVDKWLMVWDAASGASTTVISQTEQIPGTLAWSPDGETIAYAAVSTDKTGPQWADMGTFDNPAIAARRIYLLDPATGKYHRLNEVESYQDAPVWSGDGSKLYYVQRNDDLLEVVAADPATGQTETLPGRSQPVEAPDPLGSMVGYYGQFGREELLADLPTGQASAPSDEDQDILNFIFKNRQPEIGTLSEDFLDLVAAGQFTDYQRQDADVNGDDQPEILISGRNDTYYLFVAILKREADGKLQELFYGDNLNGKYVGEVRVSRVGQRVVANFLTASGGTGYVDTTWEQRWIQCQSDRCTQVWSAPLLWADRSAQWTLSRNYAVAEVAQPDEQTIHMVTHRFGLIELPWGETDAPPGTARQVIGPDIQETYRWDGQVYRLESREQVAAGQEIAREFDAQTGETENLLFEAITQPLVQPDGNYDYDAYLKTQAELWGLPAPDQPDDPTWGATSRALDIASHTGGPEQLGEWAAGVIGALDKPLCRVTVLRHAESKLSRAGQVELPCTINFTRLAWADVTGDGQTELLLTTISPDEDSLGQMERLVVFAVTDKGVTELAHLDGVINGADGRGIRWQQPAEGFKVETGLPLLDPDAAQTWSDLRLKREFQTYRWDKESKTFKPE